MSNIDCNLYYFNIFKERSLVMLGKKVLAILSSEFVTQTARE